MPRSVRHIRKRNLTEPYSVNELQYWYDYPNPKNASVKHLYNPVKERWESWHRCRRGDHEWILFNVHPGRRWKESFVASGSQFIAPVGGLVLGELFWETEANPGVVAANFAEYNEIGGGLEMITGATNGNWVALNWGSMYPTLVRKSPHTKIAAQLPDLTNVRVIGGLVGATNKPADGSGALPANFPNDGIYYEYDSAGPTIRFVTVNGGTETATNFTFTPSSARLMYVIWVNDQGTEVSFLRNGTTLARHNTNLPTAQLQPYFMLETLEDATKNLYLNDFHLIMDRGF